MKIGIDISQTAFPGSGVSRYTHGLVRSLLQINTKHEFIFFYSSLRQKPPQDLISLIKPPHTFKRFYFPPTLLSQLWNDLHIIPIEQFIGPVDLFISSDWVQPPTRHAKTLTIIHDLVMYVHPETSTQKVTFDLKKVQIRANIVDTHKRRLHWVKKDIDSIIADSKSTKKDIETHLGIQKDRIHVVYPAVHMPKPFLNQKSLNEKYDLHKPYILTVGKLEPRKNIPMLIKAFIASGLSDKTDLVIVGAHGWGDLELNVPDDIKESIVFLGYVPDDDLSSLYTYAELFVYPSIYEGFGYPVIEAMLTGTPVATSTSSSTGELAQDYAHTFDPHDMHSISQVLVSLMTNTILREKYTKKAQLYAQSFSSEKFGRDVLKIIESLL